MEPVFRLPWNLETPMAPDRAAAGVGTGAIAFPMAVSFREEKLALRATSPAVANQPGGSRSSNSLRERP